MNIKTTLFTVIGLLIAGVVYGHSDATGIVKERMNAMQDMKDKSKIVANMFKGKVDFDRTALIEAADTFVLHGSRA